VTLPYYQAADLLKRAPRCLLTTHIDPDPDGLGCEMALLEHLEAQGKQVTVLNPEATPARFAFLDPDRRLCAYQPGAPLPEVDLIVIVDTDTWAQLGPLAEVIRRRTARALVIDHHATHEQIADLVLEDREAPCTGHLVAHLLDILGASLSRPSARALFAALVFDTGWLRYDNARQAAFDLAARLVRAGAVAHEVYLALEERQPARVVRLAGLALAGLEIACHGALGVLTVTREMFALTDTSPSDITNLVNQCYSVAGVHSAVLFVEQPDGGVRVSLRSRGVVDVSAAAAEHGGGGHARAAGIRLSEPLAVVKPRLLAHLARRIAAATPTP
jgi:phosphoesterase RecJ-like protein